jgi:mannose-6-phosphate isomerase-like protein (cupin superfamily)
MQRYLPINFREKLEMFSELWSPRIIAEVDDYQFKLVKFQGTFVWHSHKESDEAFIVLEGEMDIDFQDGTAHLGIGEMFVVRRDMQHRTRAEGGCHALIIERRGIVNTGDAAETVLTASADIWI